MLPSFMNCITTQQVSHHSFPNLHHIQFTGYIFRNQSLPNESIVYLVLVTSLLTEKGRELVKEFEEDARSILSKLHHYHTKSNVAQHEVVALTTYITNLSLTDSWKGTTRQFLSHFKEKLRLLDSLIPDTDKIPETVRITFLQRAVQQNHDLRQIHVLDSVWRSKIGSTGKFTFEVYYD